jgi:hypothetical protein
MNVNEVAIGKNVYYEEHWSRCIEKAKMDGRVERGI